MTTEIRFFTLKSKKEKVLDRGQNGFECENSNVLYFVFCFVFVWCPCMAINVSVQHNNGRLLPGIILLT